jgi:hypothetical protein
MDIHGIIQMYALVTGHRGHSRGPHGMLNKQLTYVLGTGHRGHSPFVPVFNIRNVGAAVHDLELATRLPGLSWVIDAHGARHQHMYLIPLDRAFGHAIGNHVAGV